MKLSPAGSVRFSAAAYRDCRRELMEFRNANRDTVRDQRYFDWRYRNRPGCPEPVTVWAENEKGEKVGSLSLIPHSYSVDRKICPLGVLGDISVAKECRGMGLAQQMLNYLSGLDAVKGLAACMVLPNEDAARALEKSGWVKAARLDRYVKVLDAGRMLEKKVGRLAAGAISLPAGFILRALSHELFLKTPAGLSARLVDRFDDSFDELWDEVSKEGIVIGIRNKEYLTWRYSEHPIAKYQIFAVTYNARLCGYIVFNVERDKCHIYDLLCLKEDGYPVHLLSSFLSFVRKNMSCSAVSVNASETMSLGVPFGRFGFMRRPDYLDFMVLVDSDGGPDCLLKAASWFLTPGDKDV